ncbi:hypothetical protein ATG71_3261 [Bacillus sp. es.034]|nr:hypothetical protein ATG71_3261 [Bacillus sp. es.034]
MVSLTFRMIGTFSFYVTTIQRAKQFWPFEYMLVVLNFFHYSHFPAKSVTMIHKS